MERRLGGALENKRLAVDILEQRRRSRLGTQAYPSMVGDGGGSGSLRHVTLAVVGVGDNSEH